MTVPAAAWSARTRSAIRAAVGRSRNWGMNAPRVTRGSRLNARWSENHGAPAARATSATPAAYPSGGPPAEAADSSRLCGMHGKAPVSAVSRAARRPPSGMK
jgi:hypothetical protein